MGKIKVEHIETVIEPDLVFPLIRGRDVLRWQARPSASIILVNRTDKLAGIPESEMKLKYRKTYAYLKTFEVQLRKRASNSVRRLMETGPFYSIFAVGPYTLASWKVMWPEVGHTVRAGVCGPKKVGSEKPALPDHTVVAVSCSSGREAHFICALLNSSPAQSAASGYIVLHPSPHIMEHIGIPKYDPEHPGHRRLSSLSESCHSATAKDEMEELPALEAEIDNAAAKLWGITDNELKAIQEALAETGKPKRWADRSTDDAE